MSLFFKVLCFTFLAYISVGCTKQGPKETVEAVSNETIQFNFEETFKYYAPDFSSSQQIADYRGFVKDIVVWESNIKKTKASVLSSIQGLLSYKVIDVRTEGRNATVSTVIMVPEFSEKFDMQIAFLSLTRPPLISNRVRANKTIVSNIKEKKFKTVPVSVVFNLIKKDKWRISNVSNLRQLWKFENEEP